MPMCRNTSASCAALRPSAQHLSGKCASVSAQRGLTHACVEGHTLERGPRASFCARPTATGNHDQLHEAILARGARMAYVTTFRLTATVWLDELAQQVSVAALFERYGQTLDSAQRVLDELLRAPLHQPGLAIHSALASELLTPQSDRARGAARVAGGAEVVTAARGMCRKRPARTARPMSHRGLACAPPT